MSELQTNKQTKTSEK